MLSTKYNLSDVNKIGKYTPFPRYEENGWRTALPEIAAEWIAVGEKYLDYTWPPITASMYTTLGTTGSLRPHWDRFRERRSALGTLVMAEYLEGKGRFLDQILDGIISTCEETGWITPLQMIKDGHEIPFESDNNVDLCSSETASMLAWADYLVGDALSKKSARVRKRVKDVVSSRVIRPFLDIDDYWWMGFTGERTNNWNPWCNKNVIACLLLIEDDLTTKTRGIYKAMRSLDAYVEAYSEDGCCDEGPMYWGAAGGGLYLCLEILHEASNGAIDVFDNKKLRLMGQYITKTFIDGQYFVDYADGDAIVPLSVATYRFGKAIKDEGMMLLGAMAERVKPAIFDWFQLYQLLRDLFREETDVSEGYYPAQSWLWKAQVMNARECEGSAKGFFLSAKGGHNLESHNHNDIGNFIVYYNGKPLVIDIGTEEYSVKTFSPQRFEIWYLRSDYHNCFQVGCIDQHDGGDFFAQDVECVQSEFESRVTMELSRAYPPEAGIVNWRREVSLCRKSKSVIVSDDFLLDKPKQVDRFLITAVKPEIAPEGIKFEVNGENVFAEVSGECETIIEEIPITESRLCRNWEDMIYRIILRETTEKGNRIITFKR